MRHKIIENYIGYNKEVTLTNQKFEELLQYTAMTDWVEFYKWYEREDSKYSLLSLGVYHHISVSSPYPSIIRKLLNFIHNDYRVDNFDNWLNCWGEYSDTEKRILLYVIPLSSLFLTKQPNEISDELSTIILVYNKISNQNLIAEKLSEGQINTFVNFIHNYTTTNSWSKLASGINSSYTLSHFIKSLIKIDNYKHLSTCDRNVSFKCYSSPIIALCKVLFEPYAKLIECNNLEKELQKTVNWILSTSKNDQLPFGEQNFGATSLFEYKEIFYLNETAAIDLSKMEAVLNDKKSITLEEISSLQEKIVSIKKIIKQKENLVKHKNIALDRITFLKTFLADHPVDKLMVISQLDFPLQYYPESLINIDEKYVKSLDQKTKSKLMEKLRFVKKGYYKKLTKFL